MTGLARRSRALRLRRLIAGNPDPLPAAPRIVEIPPGSPYRFRRDLAPGFFSDDCQSVSRLLYERLGETARAEIAEWIARDPDLAGTWAAADTQEAQVALLLTYGAWLEHPAITDELGLGRQDPPEEIHAMARGPLAAAGGLYEADMIANALRSAGAELSEIGSALDFGCSSGRVLRALRAAHPQIAWHGCDPNAPAIEWAQANLPGMEFFISGNEPPLPLPDASLDLVYAISIWSHFEPGLGLRWFEEMRRILRPGGFLLVTTHGETSVVFYAERGLRTPMQSDEILAALYRHGSWYAPEFGPAGDWGVVNPSWGTAFLTAEWILAHLCPHWRVLEFAPARNQENQDFYVLQRV